MPKCALPDHLKNRKHGDWIWPLSYISRGWSAFGPRCPGRDCQVCNGKGYRPWPPKLVEGKGVTRWENAGASSILYIPSLSDKIINPDFYGTNIRAWETNPANPYFNTEKWVSIKWEIGNTSPNMYFPSALQRWSRFGYLRMTPRYWTIWKVIKQKENPFKSTRVTGENKVLFWRNGYRNDALDVYYNNGPMLGLQMD